MIAGPQGGLALLFSCRKLLTIAVIGITFLSLAPFGRSSAPKGTVPARYRTWLNEEVPYIISEEERSEFLSLRSDQDRDAFIRDFWDARNPDPNAPTNLYRDEHYRRLKYASDHFGTPGRHDGWRTDRGMVYITLGPPQQRTPYPNSQYLTPLEIWFYQSPSTNHALPPYFSVVFYQRSLNEDYRLYSPVLDRPERLVQSTNAVNDDRTALKIIERDLGAEVEHLALSLIPGEPVDLKTATPSLESDAMLNRIRNFRNLAENRELVDERRANHESVTHKVILGEQFSDLSVIGTRDGESQASISYLLQLFHPQDFSIAQQPDGRYYYSILIDASLETAAGQMVYRDLQELTSYLGDADVAARRNKRFAVEGRLAAAPGSYLLHLTVTNKVSGQAFTQTRPVVLPGFDSDLGLSQPLVLSLHKPATDPANTAPFTFAGIRLEPVGSDNARLAPGQPIRLVFQVWDHPSAKTGVIQASYTLGQLGRADKEQVEQSLDRASMDRSGSLLVGKDLPTSELAPGPYRLVVRLDDPTSHSTASQAINLRIEGPPDEGLWTLVSPSFHAVNDPTDAYRRGQCAASQHSLPLAVYYFRQALAAGYSPQAAYSALAAVYREAGNTAAAEDASNRAGTPAGKTP